MYMQLDFGTDDIFADRSKYPYLALSISSLEHIGVYILVEKTMVAYTKDVYEALFALVAVYYCSDMAYPYTFSALLTFVAEIFMEIKDDSQNLPPFAKRVLSSIQSRQINRSDLS